MSKMTLWRWLGRLEKARGLAARFSVNDVKFLTSLTMAKFRPLSMILRLRHACLLISQIQIRVPEIGIENVPEIENVPVE